MSDDLEFATIAELSSAIERRQLSALELVESLIARSERYEPMLNAFITPTYERALETAREVERDIGNGRYRGAMHGIPFGLKDIYETSGLPTTAHSQILRHHVSTFDATTTTRLHDAGGVLMGKLATHEFAHGGPSFDLPWPPARNPWDLNHETGGSSSGSAAAVAAGLMPVALGTDTGGSIRGPAGLCGLVGLKPTYGLVSRYGILANSYSYDHAGPLTRSVEDAAIVLQTLAGHDPLDPASADIELPNYRDGLDGDVKGLRIGVIRHFFETDQPASDPVRLAIEEAISVFRALGADVRDVRLRPLEIYQDIKVTQAEPEVFSIHQHELQTRLDEYGEDFLGRVLPACLITATDYLSASRERRRVIDEMAAVYEQFDVLLTIGPGPAAPFGRWRVLDFWTKGSITAPFNVTGGPALVQCMGFTDQGLPMSLQLSARPFAEPSVLRAAYAYERETQWLKRRPEPEATTALDLPERPEPATATISESERDLIAIICERAGLQPNERQFEQLAATAPLVEARVARIHRIREWHEEPSNVFRNR